MCASADTGLHGQAAIRDGAVQGTRARRRMAPKEERMWRLECRHAKNSVPFCGGQAWPSLSQRPALCAHGMLADDSATKHVRPHGPRVTGLGHGQATAAPRAKWTRQKSTTRREARCRSRCVSVQRLTAIVVCALASRQLATKTDKQTLRGRHGITSPQEIVPTGSLSRPLKIVPSD
jgi:hypothetical protein